MRRGRCRESRRATAMARQRRTCCEAVEGGEPPKGGERGESGGGAQRTRRDALMRGMGESRRRCERSERATAAIMHGHGCTHPQAKRAASECERRRQGSSPEGRRPRQRAPWSRAGRSRARRNRARRPVVRPGGRPDLRPGRAVDIELSSAMIGYDPDAERIEFSPDRAASGGLVAALDAATARGEIGGVVDGGAGSAAAICRS